MKKDAFYRVVIIILLLLNLATLSFLWMGRRGGPGKDGHPQPPDRVIIDRLQLDKQQQEQFFHLREEHHGQMVEIQKTSAHLHKVLFALLQQEQVPAATRDSLMDMIEKTDRHREEVTFEHFRKLRGILRPQQKEELDDLVGDLSEQIMGPHRRPRR